MKISPMSSVTVPTSDAHGNLQPSRVESMKAIRMSTDASPLSNMVPGPISDPINETMPADEATQPLSPQLALLAKQRRALQVKERELADREKAFQSQSTGSSGIDVARLKSQPLSVLLENGVTYDQLTEAILADQGNSEINSLKEELESLKKGIDQRFTDKDAAAEKQVLAEMRREAESLTRSGDDYELVRETRSLPDVMKLIERTYHESGEILEVSEALQLVEDELFKDAQRIAQLKKIQSQFIPPTQQPQQRPQGMRTLSNRDTASPPLDARGRAMAAFYGTLKK